MRRVVIPLIGAALAVVLASASIALAQPTSTTNPTGSVVADDPASDNVAPDRVSDRATDRRERTQGVLDELVEEEVITQGQADIIRERFRERVGDKRRDNHQRRLAGHVFGEARRVFLDTVGISPEELRASLADGATIGEVAQRNGVTQNDVVTALISAADAALDKLVANERITKARAAEIRNRIDERAEQFVERMWERSRDRPRDRHRDRTERSSA